MSHTYYDILNIPRTARKEEIRASFRQLAKKFHPDLNPGSSSAEEKFKKIQEAYSVLSDDEKRKNYDLKLTYGAYFGKTTYKKTADQHSSRKTNPPPHFRSADFRKSKKKPSYLIPIFLSGFVVVLVVVMIVTMIKEQKERDRIARTLPPSILQFDPTKEKKSPSSLTPYEKWFGEGEVDKKSFNKMVVINSDQTEAVIVLVRVPEEKIVRHLYLERGGIRAMERIPDGLYYTRILFGNDWDRDSSLVPGALKGFYKENVYICRYPTKGYIEFQSLPDSTHMNYRLSVDPRLAGDVNSIPPSEFFRR